MNEFNSFEYTPKMGVQAYYHQLVLLNMTLSKPHNKPALSLKEGFSASDETLNNPRQRDLPCLMKGN
jgi:hypothetical protein